MLLQLDCSLRDLLAQALEHHSPHYILCILAELRKHPNSEEFANICVKLLETGDTN